MPQKHEFDALLTKGGDAANAGYFVEVPPEVVAAFGKKGQVKVKAEVDGYAFRTSVVPYSGRRMFVVRKEIRAAIGKLDGGDVHVTLEVDTEPRVVEVPPDFASAMSADVRAAFDTLSFSHQKEYVDWIVDAKRAETRQRRIDKALEMITGGIRTPR